MSKDTFHTLRKVFRDKHMCTSQLALKELTTKLWSAGVAQADGSEAVKARVARYSLAAPTHILAVGKAASSMMLGAIDAFEGDIPALVITKYDHAGEHFAPYSHVDVIEAAHPIPDNNSLAAGQAALDFVSNIAPDGRLLLLVSGGASSLAEVLRDGVTLEKLQSVNKDLISTDRTIEEINTVRRTLSHLKSGGLLSRFKGAHSDVVLISDVEGDDPNVIGSGLGVCDPSANTTFTFNSTIAANNASARAAIVDAAKAQDLTIAENSECLYGEISDLAPKLARTLIEGPNGVYIWGGEPIVNLPENPGKGGRNQALALLLARELSGESGIALVCGGTDGTDGPTSAAGGIVDGTTYDEHLGHDAHIQGANAGEGLAEANSLLITGPTGTNVMDLIVAIKTS